MSSQRLGDEGRILKEDVSVKVRSFRPPSALRKLMVSIKAQVHSLSGYVPNCLSCGLILCEVNLPFHLCPSCSKDLTDSRQTQLLISKLEVEIAAQIAKEIEEKDRVDEEARRNVESFPTLHPPSSASGPNSNRGSPHSTRRSTPEPSPYTAQAHTRKVLSLSTSSKSGRNKVTMSTFTAAPVSKSSGASTGTDKDASREENSPVRIAASLTPHALDLTNCRRWQDPRVESLIYVALPTPRPSKSDSSGPKGGKKGRQWDGDKKDEGVAGPSRS